MASSGTRRPWELEPERARRKDGELLLQQAAKDAVPSSPGTTEPEAALPVATVARSAPEAGGLQDPAGEMRLGRGARQSPGGAAAEPGAAGPQSEPEALREYILFLEEDGSASTLADRARSLLSSQGLDAEPSALFPQLNGFALSLSDQQAQRFQALAAVLHVGVNAAVFLEPAAPAQLAPVRTPEVGILRPPTTSPATVSTTTTTPGSLPTYANATASSGETIPWGVLAVWQGEDISKRGNFASDTYAFVIDSGVLNTTADLNLASTSSWHRSWISGETPFTDGNGHGTHVAGTIAALANGKGVVGVAPGAQVVSLKVFDSNGGGASYSTIISAIDHAVAVINNNGLDKSKVVINMSLGGGYSSSLDTAVKNAAAKGIRLALAAGNDGQDADGYSPAAAGDHANVFTVSAVDSSYRMATWSNWDRLDGGDSVDDVDFAAPGVTVLSYYRNGQLANLSGTSMASPHVAGLLLAGGVQPGPLVTPAYAGTADPFALGIKPSTPDPEPPPPAPTYSLTSPSGVDEGKRLDIGISTTNLSAGTQLYWRISGTGISSSDFTALASLDGSVSTATDGSARVSLDMAADATTEGAEQLRFTLFSDALRTLEVAAVSVTIADTSTTPTTPDLILWGTTANDLITGGSGNDRISGVVATGTRDIDMGARQIDTLTGGPGKDIFVLGDSRGVFYDDRQNGNVGSGDYARIKDFRSGEDKLQLFSASYIFTVSRGNLTLYWDRNNNGVLNTSGSSRDEMIALLEGVTSIAATDIVWV